MKRVPTRFTLIAVQSVLVLLTICFLQPQAHARQVREYILLSITEGTESGQSLRLTLFNPSDPNSQDGDAPVRAWVKLFDAGGSVVAQSSEATVPAGEFHSFDFKRSDISAPGEAGTGRVQLRATCWVRVATPWNKSQGLAVSVEAITDGTSNTVFFSEVIPHDSRGNVHLHTYWGAGHSIGLVPGQTLRVSAFNPSETDANDGQREPILSQVKLYDAQGNVIAQSDEITLDPGQSHSFDFNRAGLPLAGEPGTGRVQLRVEVQQRFFPGIASRSSQGGTDMSPVTIELVDAGTGRTAVLGMQKPKEIVVVSSTGY